MSDNNTINSEVMRNLSKINKISIVYPNYFDKKGPLFISLLKVQYYSFKILKCELKNLFLNFKVLKHLHVLVDDKLLDVDNF